MDELRSIIFDSLLSAGYALEIAAKVVESEEITNFDNAVDECERLLEQNRRLERQGSSQSILAPLGSGTLNRSDSLSEKKSRPILLRRSSSKMSGHFSNTRERLIRHESFAESDLGSLKNREQYHELGHLEYTDDSDVIVDTFSNALFSELASTHLSKPLKTGSYFNVTAFALYSVLKEQMEQITVPFSLTLAQGMQIFKCCEWDIQLVKQKCTDDLSSVLKMTGVSEESSSSLQPDENGEYMCIICICPYPREEVQSLECGHVACTTCWKMHMEIIIKDMQCEISCPAADCHLEAKENMIHNLVDKEVFEKYMIAFMRRVVRDHPYIKWCNGINCDRVFVSDGEGIVRCDCGDEMCFTCNKENHLPCDCETMEKWTLREQNQDESLKWLKANCKQCPKCNFFIQKNDGCNHMTCGQCRYEFCWICMKDYRQYGACSKVQDNDLPSGDEESKIRKDLKRYEAYSKVYTGHSNSKKMAVKALKETIQKANEQAFASATGTASKDLSYLVEANRALIKARQVICNYCVFLFYNAESTLKELIEFHQSELINAAEELNHIISNNPHLKPSVLAIMGKVNAICATISEMQLDLK